MISKKDLDKAIQEFSINYFFGDIRHSYKDKNSIIKAYETYTPKYITLCGIRFYELLPMDIQSRKHINTVRLCYQSDVQTDDGVYPIANFKFMIYRTPNGNMITHKVLKDIYIDY